LILKSLDIQGFKSFPDKIKLSFTKGISAVVGPNGSGKSNISDAIRWVLGEQSTKNLRGSKMEDVVFFGTAVRKPVGFAEVTLTVDNADRRIEFDSDEIAITRRYYRSGDSEYKINGASVRLKDIHEMLMDTGLGRDGYSIVSQGKITGIVESRSDGRREIFEEAAGISKYRYRKNEAEKRLNLAEENLLRLRDILLELEAQVGPLKEQSEKAKAFLALSGEKKELEVGLWLYDLAAFKDELREQSHKLALASSQHEEADNYIKDLQEQIDSNFSSSNKIVSDIDEIRRKSASLEEGAVRCESEAQLLRNNIYHNKETIARIMSDLEESQRGSSAMQSDIAANREKIKLYLQNKASLQAKIEGASLDMEKLRLGDEKYSAIMEEKNRSLTECSIKSSDSKVAAVAASTQINEIQSRMESITSDFGSIKEKSERMSNELAETEEALQLAANRIEELTNALNGYKMRLEKREAKSIALKGSVDSLGLEIKDKTNRAALLENMEKNLEGFSHTVKTVIKQAQIGTLSGIHGPISQIISANAEYATAIETALGAAMQNIVVGTEEDAKRAISYLKRSDGGRATFLPLTSVKGSYLQQNGLEDCFGFVGLATDLVNFEPKYKDIAASLLGRTAVAEDIDSAVAIARKYGYKFRIVTLDGQIINAGGSLTGGSAIKSAHLISRRNDIEALRAEAAKLEQKLSSLHADYTQAVEEASAAKAALTGTQGELTSAQEDKIRFEAECRRLKENCELLERSRTDLAKEQASASKRIEELEAKRAQAEDEIEEYSQQASVLEAEMSELTGSIGQITFNRELLSSQLQEFKLQMLSAEKEVESLEQAIAGIEQRLNSQSGRTEALRSEAAQLEQNNLKIEQNAEKEIAKAAELRESSKLAAGEIDELNNRRMELEQTSSKLRQEERDKSVEREALGRELAKLEEQKTAINRRYDDIIRKLWDEYELTLSQAQEASEPVKEPQKANRRLGELRNQIKQLGSVNVAAIEQYAEVSQRYELMRAQVSDVELSKIELLKMINEFTQSMKEIFNSRFAQINSHFGEIFVSLFGGGSAHFSLTDPEDVLNSGIEIHAQPPGKNITHLESLSGGEKSLIAIAIYFAIMKVNPSPFCVLDEIEAALDDVNVDRYAAYLRRMSGNTQFIVITHRRGTMEEADVIYGVTMQNEGVSKLLELDLTQAREHLGG
jgi:chromosome segregation protein